MTFSLGSIRFYRRQPESELPKVAISACLHGEAVRYDGSDKFLESTSTILANYLQLLPICPEVGAGMSVPRPPVQLVQYPDGIRVLGHDDPALDVTTALDSYRQQSAQGLGQQLCGYVLKSRSPSCGLNSTPIFAPDGKQLTTGSGMQAAFFHKQLPWLTMVEETDLESRGACEDFIVRCQLFADVRTACDAGSCQVVHSHYQTVLELMPTHIQQRLETFAAQDEGQSYWQTFGEGLQTIDA